MKIPVTIIIFNRPENTKRLFESLNIYKPETLFVISEAFLAPSFNSNSMISVLLIN